MKKERIVCPATSGLSAGRLAGFGFAAILALAGIACTSAGVEDAKNAGASRASSNGANRAGGTGILNTGTGNGGAGGSQCGQRHHAGSAVDQHLPESGRIGERAVAGGRAGRPRPLGGRRVHSIEIRADLSCQDEPPISRGQ